MTDERLADFRAGDVAASPIYDDVFYAGLAMLDAAYNKGEPMDTKEPQDLTIAEANTILAYADKVRELLGRTPSAPVAGDSQLGLRSLVGHAIFIRTVTNHYTGKLLDFDGHELVIEDAAWIADDGRFGTALATGELNEVEPFPSGAVLIGRSAIVDVCRWGHALPRGVK
jgi:hypothetical protein